VAEDGRATSARLTTMKSQLRSFIAGALSAIAVLVVLALLAPLYSDYRSRAEAANMLTIAAPLQEAVEAHAAASHTLQGSGVGVEATSEYFDAIVQQDGTIVLHSRKTFGQVLVLLPAFHGSTVEWRCIGGSARDVPTWCRWSP